MINYGKKSLKDAIENHLNIKNILTTKKNLDFVQSLNIDSINVKIVNESYFKDLENIKHQFIAYEIDKNPLNIKQILNKLKQQANSIVLILDSIEDPRNFGSILRTCDAFKIDAVFFKKHNQAPINNVVNSISMGATNYLDLCEANNLNNLIQDLKETGFWIYSTTLNKNSIPYYKEKFPPKVCIIVGNENKGISELIIKNSDMNLYIPMFGHVQSLNVSVATGIILSYIKINQSN